MFKTYFSIPSSKKSRGLIQALNAISGDASGTYQNKAIHDYLVKEAVLFIDQTVALRLLPPTSHKQEVEAQLSPMEFVFTSFENYQYYSEPEELLQVGIFNGVTVEFFSADDDRIIGRAEYLAPAYLSMFEALEANNIITQINQGAFNNLINANDEQAVISYEINVAHVDNDLRLRFVEGRPEQDEVIPLEKRSLDCAWHLLRNIYLSSDSMILLSEIGSFSTEEIPSNSRMIIENYEGWLETPEAEKMAHAIAKAIEGHLPNIDGVQTLVCPLGQILNLPALQKLI